MGQIGPGMIPHGGTYSGNAVAAAAAIATLEAIDRGALGRVEAHGRMLMEGIGKILKERGVSAVVQGPPSMFGVIFTDRESVSDYRDWAASDHDTYEAVILKLFEKGIMPDKDSREPWFVSAAHSEADAQQVLGGFEEALKEVLP
jgi:glutamate-1-semialdehyde 2,1-aminomutase